MEFVKLTFSLIIWLVFTAVMTVVSIAGFVASILIAPIVYLFSGE
jgi:hypothetical protein